MYLTRAKLKTIIKNDFPILFDFYSLDKGIIKTRYNGNNHTIEVSKIPDIRALYKVLSSITYKEANDE